MVKKDLVHLSFCTKTMQHLLIKNLHLFHSVVFRGQYYWSKHPFFAAYSHSTTSFSGKCGLCTKIFA